MKKGLIVLVVFGVVFSFVSMVMGIEPQMKKQVTDLGELSEGAFNCEQLCALKYAACKRNADSDDVQQAAACSIDHASCELECWEKVFPHLDSEDAQKLEEKLINIQKWLRIQLFKKGTKKN